MLPERLLIIRPSTIQVQGDSNQKEHGLRAQALPIPLP